MRRTAYSFEIKAVQEDGTFSGLASVYGNKDLHGDIVLPGAFTQTLKKKGAEVPILWQHRMDEPIGLGRLEDSVSGLVMHGELTMEVARARECHALLKKRVIKGLSIGYDTVNEKVEDGIRKLLEVDLWEVSCVTFAANPLATVFTVKELVEIAHEVKSGRVLSARNLDQLQAAIDALQTILAAAVPAMQDESPATDSPDKNAPALTAGAELPDDAVITGLKALFADIRATAAAARM